MCGIAGIYFKNTAVSQGKMCKTFSDAVQLMRHRGPDNFGEFSDGNLHLYHFRLSILDLDKRSNQPFGEENKIVFNGEIYNYRDLKQEYNISTQTTSDTEVLYKMLKSKKEKVLSELNGIFSIAYYDRSEDSLLIARDRLGVKPLYYIDSDQFFAFSSEAKVLYQFLPALELNFRAMYEFVWFGSSISESTLVNNVKKLNPGSYIKLRLSSGKKTSGSFWSFNKDVLKKNENNRDSYTVARRKTRVLLEKAVQRQCVSDVPVGAYLSGGIDSSSIVALASRYTKTTLNTYTVVFDKSDNKEHLLAKKVATKYGTNHHEIEVNANGLPEVLEKIIFQYDEPFADAAAIPLHLIASKNKSVARVVLQGDGGDELFSGYGRHLDSAQLNRRRIASYILSHFAFEKSKREAMQKRSWALNAKPDWKRMARQVANPPNTALAEVFLSTWKKAIEEFNPFETYRKVASNLGSLNPHQKLLYTDMQVILPHTYLEKVDKINMFHSIEARVPLLDNDLVDYVLSLPSHYKLRKGITKSFYREVVSDLIPDDILYSRKMSFGTPVSEWLRTSLYDYAFRIFAESRKSWSHVLNLNMLLQKLIKHQKREEENASLLWRALILVIWLNIYKNKLKSYQSEQA